ncbi:MAG: hypothetical protein RL322_2007 [Pseudomonadota bacterium]|jgi:hypothetical protein
MKRDLVLYLMALIALLYPFLHYQLDTKLVDGRVEGIRRLVDVCNVEGTHCKPMDRGTPPQPYGMLYLNQ